MSRLVCVSNRITLPRKTAAAGGLAVGVLAAMRVEGGLWFGWSGDVAAEPAAQPAIVSRDGIDYSTIDLTQTQ